MYNDLEYKNKIVVGLIMTFALLFFCTGVSIQQQKTLEMMLLTDAEDSKENTGSNSQAEIVYKPVDPNQPMIALTFDDGPGVGTVRLIEALQAHGARATFFMMGSRVNTYPDAVRKMVEAGCEIANHTTNHLKLTDYGAEGVAMEINYTRDVINSIVGQTPTMVRPPYGAVNEVVQSVAGVPIMLWSVDTLDWQLKDAGLIRDYVLNNVKDGDIVLMHDIYEATVQATIELIPLLQERGYQIVTVSEMAKARGITLENGAKYYNFYK